MFRVLENDEACARLAAQSGMTFQEICNQLLCLEASGQGTGSDGPALDGAGSDGAGPDGAGPDELAPDAAALDRAGFDRAAQKAGTMLGRWVNDGLVVAIGR